MSNLRDQELDDLLKEIGVDINDLIKDYALKSLIEDEDDDDAIDDAIDEVIADEIDAKLIYEKDQWSLLKIFNRPSNLNENSFNKAIERLADYIKDLINEELMKP